ncbi:BrnT family toxin [Methylobacterium mesophilicum]
MRIEWDEAKRQQNLLPEPDGHGLDFADARDRFDFDAAVVVPTYPGRDGRPRFIAIGWFDDHLRSLVFSPLGAEALSIISFRPASRRERKIHDKA